MYKISQSDKKWNLAFITTCSLRNLFTVALRKPSIRLVQSDKDNNQITKGELKELSLRAFII